MKWNIFRAGGAFFILRDSKRNEEGRVLGAQTEERVVVRAPLQPVFESGSERIQRSLLPEVSN
jgi:hypothetical protein